VVLRDFFFFGGTGVLTQDLTLARQMLSHLSHSVSTFFCEGFFEIGSCGTICPGWL
jgi:hypothetical protein